LKQFGRASSQRGRALFLTRQESAHWADSKWTNALLNIIKMPPRDLQCRPGRHFEATLSRSVSTIVHLSARSAQLSHHAKPALRCHTEGRARSTGSTINDPVFDRRRPMSNGRPMGQPGAGRPAPVRKAWLLSKYPGGLRFRESAVPLGQGRSSPHGEP
jgi:hypothetical protein